MTVNKHWYRDVYPWRADAGTGGGKLKRSGLASRGLPAKAMNQSEAAGLEIETLA